MSLQKVEIIKCQIWYFLNEKNKVEENSQNFLGIGNYFPEKDAVTFVKHLQFFHSSSWLFCSTFHADKKFEKPFSRSLELQWKSWWQEKIQLVCNFQFTIGQLWKCQLTRKRSDSGWPEISNFRIFSFCQIKVLGSLKILSRWLHGHLRNGISKKSR